MKTAEEWRDKHKCIPFPHMAVLSVSEIKAIQLDAMKEGYWRAAVLAEHIRIAMLKNYGVAESIGADASKAAILSAAEQLKVEDL